MNYEKFKKWIIYLLMGTMLHSCQKEEQGCFNGRDKGDGTISFYIDGELWQNSCEWNNTGSINGTANNSMGLYGYDDHQNIEVYGVQWGESRIYIGLTSSVLNEVSVFGDGLLIYDGILDPFDHSKITLSYDNKEYLSLENKGFAMITRREYDTINDIFHKEGVFQATLCNVEDSTDLVSITDGFWNN